MTIHPRPPTSAPRAELSLVAGFGQIAVPSEARACAQLAALLPAFELRQLSAAAVDKRRREFIAGRVAARRAVQALQARQGRGPIGDFLVLREPHGDALGRPVVVASDGRTRLAVHVSITHADGLALAAAAMRPIGLDLVALETLTPAFLREAFVDGELHVWARLLRQPPTAAISQCTAFACKEAALKWLGTGFGARLSGLRFMAGAASDTAAAWPPTPARLGALCGHVALVALAITGADDRERRHAVSVFWAELGSAIVALLWQP